MAEVMMDIWMEAILTDAEAVPGQAAEVANLVREAVDLMQGVIAEAVIPVMETACTVEVIADMAAIIVMLEGAPMMMAWRI